MPNKKILFISQEIAPYSAPNPVSTLGKEIPVKMQSKGYEVRTFMPRFGGVNERRNQLHEVIRLSGVNIVIDDNDHPLIIKVASLQPSRIQVYFIDNEDYFQKQASDVDIAGSNRADNDERAIFFTRGTMETAKKLRWEPKVIHCSGWITALLPLYIKKIYNDDISFKDSKIVYTIMPGNKPESIDERFLTKLRADGIPGKELKKYAKDELTSDLLHKIAIDNSDAVVILDSEVSQEIIDYLNKNEKKYIICTENDSIADKHAELFESL